ncbi:protein-glutamate O-methyltransferase CheR [Myxosarcina sp. GI1]|uniref:CheR family methyltransferase n=1 Tax=Myxosarcina sp. GI1 TaxID=1541065 RepID=UPI00068F5B80|nr:protein-glutamate O-methyltransferase CheR [Myxosarcina sp. GI1]
MISSTEFALTNLFDLFVTSICQYTGLVVKPEDRHKVARGLLQRVVMLNFKTPEAYYQYLVPKSFKNNFEWHQIISFITNNESYFFRDRSQIELLKTIVLPEIISRNQKDKKLRICSAGCSTGEEPYTLAIVLKELLPNHKQWNCKILGIDIDELALQKARSGIYPEWSFRGVEREIKQKYFHKNNQSYYLNSEFKNMVDFSQVNLVEDNFSQPRLNLRNIDLLICRNVFIYFNNDAIAKVINKFYDSLEPLGYLVTGHTEIAIQNVSKFHIRVFKESIVYQRPQTETKASVHSNSAESTKKANFELTKINSDRNNNLFTRQSLNSKPKINSGNHNCSTTNLASKTTDIKAILQKTNCSIQQKKYELALTELEKVIALEPNNIEAYNQIAKISVELREHTKAIEYCQKILQIEPLAVFPHYLLAQIEEEKGNIVAAKMLLKKVIYLEPLYANAYLDLSQIYQIEGDRQRAKEMQQAGLKILKKTSAKSEVENNN